MSADWNPMPRRRSGPSAGALATGCTLAAFALCAVALDTRDAAFGRLDGWGVLDAGEADG